VGGDSEDKHITLAYLQGMSFEDLKKTYRWAPKTLRKNIEKVCKHAAPELTRQLIEDGRTDMLKMFWAFRYTYLSAVKKVQTYDTYDL